jgi:hypothetical protein
MDNKPENDHGDVDIGAWNKMCSTVSDVRKILRALFLVLYAHVFTLDISPLVNNLKIICIRLVVGEN